MINYCKFKEEVKRYAIPSVPIEQITEWAVNHTISAHPPKSNLTHPLYSIEYRAFNEAPTGISFGFDYFMVNGNGLSLFQLVWKFSHCDTHGAGTTLKEAMADWDYGWNEYNKTMEEWVMSKLVEISHDGFARQSIARELVATKGSCDWCGSKRKTQKLFQYYAQGDGFSATARPVRGLFCSKGCMNTSQCCR